MFTQRRILYVDYQQGVNGLSSVVSILNDVIFDSVKSLEFGKKPLHDEDSKKAWLRNQEAFVNYVDGNLIRIRENYKDFYKNEPFYQMYLRIMGDIISEMGIIVGFRYELSQSEMLERIEMLLSLLYSAFSGCLGLRNMILYKKEYPLTPDDMSMYMEMKAEERRKQRML